MNTQGNEQRPAVVVLAGGQAKRYRGCKPLAPVGLHGEALIDLTVSDARAAGFGDIVVVLGPQTASAITYHVRRCWPSSVPVTFTTQQVPLGTAHALLCARESLPEGPFAVVNADDVYGTPALEVLARHLSTRTAGLRAGTDHALVAFAMRDTVVTSEPVTRGTCVVGEDRNLEAIVERRRVTMQSDGRFSSHDGLVPVEIPGDTLVSVNLWGFTSSIWSVLEAAVVATHRGVAPDGSVRDSRAVEDGVEVLLPEVIGESVAGHTPGGGPAHSVRVLDGPGRCLGVTHSEDLPIVRSELAAMVGQGLRPEGIWGGAG
jgi:molybdopterin-guanine dinucleotide biosynthesis protein A